MRGYSVLKEVISVERVFRFFVSWGLLISGTVTAVTGFLSDWWGLSQVRLHIWSGYIVAILGVVHGILNVERLLTWPFRREVGTLRPQRPRPSLVPASHTRRHFLRGLGVGMLVGLVSVFLAPLAFNWRPREDNLGRAYHRWSRITLRGVLWSGLRWGAQPPQYKVYPDAPRVVLPAPQNMPISLLEAINRRRSLRDYTGEGISLEALSALLHAAQGITEPSYPKRAAPSAGALYPMEIYAVVHRVEGLEPGVYHYAVREHALELVRAGDLRQDLTLTCLDQEHVYTAAVVFVLSAIFQREEWKYQGRAYRYILMEAGHIGQNIYLAATGLGLGACAIGAFYDDRLDALLGIDGEEEVSLYVLTVGHVA